MRWLWIDRMEEFDSRRSARATKLVSVAEDEVHELYPGVPIYPHSLILEGLAQTGGILVGEANDFRELVVLAKIPSAKFTGYATAGDRLEYAVTLADLRAEGAMVEGKVFRNGEPMAEAEIFFAHLDKSAAFLGGRGGENFVFQKDHLLALLAAAKRPEPQGDGA